MIKLNFDALFFNDTNLFLGLLQEMQDNWWVPVLTLIDFDRCVCGRSTCMCILFAVDLCFQHVVIEGDNLTAIKNLNSDAADRSILNPIIHDILSRRHSFTALIFNHVFCEANGATHAMAFLGYQLTNPQFWVEKAPAAVEQAT